MNFFQQQDIARKNTRRLVFLFLLAVFSLVAITNLFLALFPWHLNSETLSENGSNKLLVCLMTQGCNFWAAINWERMVWISVGVVGVIGGVSLYKWLSIMSGGKKVAEMMGGTMVSANTTDAAEKRLLNVVEEMALASNMPVPAIYVMKHELGINAFAAGFSSKDAVVAVTAGTLEALNRDQLQGVIAHEFSHILNGDMRLNMKLIAILYGIMFITEAGFVFLRGSRHSRRNNSGPTIMLGIGLVVIGAIGTFFGNLIKAAVSRQREFLADASAVQFTRDPSSIADALKTIGGSSHGSLIDDSHGSEISHLFFSSSMSWAQSFFSTHPPLAERIRRIEPRWDGKYLKPSAAQQTRFGQQTEDKPGMSKDQKLGAMAAAVILSEAANSSEPDESIQFKPQDALHEPLAAAAAICCLLLHVDEGEHKQQLAAIQKQWPALHDAIEESTWRNSQREDFLPIAELATSGLRMLTADEYSKFKQLLIKLIKADGVIDIYEWALYYLIKSSVDTHFKQSVLVISKYKKPKAIENEIVCVLSMLIHSTSQSDSDKLKAFQHACNISGVYNLASDEVPVCKMHEFNMAIQKITAAYPLLKSRIIKALIEAAKIDGTIEMVEKHTIMAIAAAIDTPVANIFLQEMEL